MALKFSYQDFNRLDTGDLFINIWSDSESLKHSKNHNLCQICGIYRRYCYHILRRRWQPEWGNFAKIMDKLFKVDKYFLNVGKYSSSTRHLIIRDLKNMSINL